MSDQPNRQQNDSQPVAQQQQGQTKPTAQQTAAPAKPQIVDWASI